MWTGVLLFVVEMVGMWLSHDKELVLWKPTNAEGIFCMKCFFRGEVVLIYPKGTASNISMVCDIPRYLMRKYEDYPIYAYIQRPLECAGPIELKVWKGQDIRFMDMGSWWVKYGGPEGVPKPNPRELVPFRYLEQHAEGKRINAEIRAWEERMSWAIRAEDGKLEKVFRKIEDLGWAAYDYVTGDKGGKFAKGLVGTMKNLTKGAIMELMESTSVMVHKVEVEVKQVAEVVGGDIHDAIVHIG